MSNKYFISHNFIKKNKYAGVKTHLTMFTIILKNVLYVNNHDNCATIFNYINTIDTGTNNMCY